MATLIVSSRANSANLSPASLSKAREAFVERVDAAALDAQRRCSMGGMPFHLSAACSYLADAGVVAPASRGEQFFGWDLTTSRRYLAGLDPAARHAEIEAGASALFETRNPICPDIAKARVVTARIARKLEIRWARTSAAYFDRHDAKLVAANDGDEMVARG